MLEAMRQQVLLIPFLTPVLICLTDAASGDGGAGAAQSRQALELLGAKKFLLTFNPPTQLRYSYCGMFLKGIEPIEEQFSIDNYYNDRSKASKSSLKLSSLQIATHFKTIQTTLRKLKDLGFDDEDKVYQAMESVGSLEVELIIGHLCP